MRMRGTRLALFHMLGRLFPRRGAQILRFPRAWNAVFGIPVPAHIDFTCLRATPHRHYLALGLLSNKKKPEGILLANSLCEQRHKT